MRKSVQQSYQNILKIPNQQNQPRNSISPLTKKKRAKSETFINKQSSDNLINSTTRDEESTRAFLESIRLENERKRQEEFELNKKIENYKYQHEKDQCYITHLQQEVMDLEMQIKVIQEKQKQIMLPIKMNAKMFMDKLALLEMARMEYQNEEDELSKCLQTVLDQNEKITQAFQEKCQEIEKIKSTKQIP